MTDETYFSSTAAAGSQPSSPALASGMHHTAGAAKRAVDAGLPHANEHTRRGDRWLWFWPVIAVITMATSGELLGPFGALLAEITAIGAITLFLGIDYFTATSRLVVSILVGFALLAVVIGHTKGWAVLRIEPTAAEGGTHTATPSAYGLNFAGRRLLDRDIASRDLRGARFTGANLDRLSLVDADLAGADANGASLRGGLLDGANLDGAILRGADLQLAQLRRADLRNADLRGADLRGADLSGSCLRGADLSGAWLNGADFLGAATLQITVDSEATAAAREWPTKPTDAGCA